MGNKKAKRKTADLFAAKKSLINAVIVDDIGEAKRNVKKHYKNIMKDISDMKSFWCHILRTPM